MQRIVEFTDGKDFYAVPENDVKNFLAEDPKSTRVRRFVGKDGSSYAVPDYDVKAFLAEDSDVEEVFPVQTTDGKSYLVPQSASKGRITKFNSKAFANDEAMGGAKLGALEAQAEGGVGAYEDDGSIGNWFKNLWNTFSHAAGGKMVSGDMQAKTHQLVNNAYKGADGKDHSFEDLPDEVLDQYMNTIAPNGYWSYLGNAIGLGGKNNFMAEWDKNVGSKIEDPIERKKARVAYAREFAQISFENTEREKDRARAEIEGREKAFGAGAVAGTTQIAGYALPMMAPGGVGLVLSAGVEGTTRRNQLLQDGYEVTDSGEIIRTSKGDTRNQALVKGAVGGATTALIEKYGGKLAGKALGKVAGKIPGADKIAGSSVGKFLSKTGKFIDRYFGWTGQQNAPEEYAEEFLQGLTDAAFGLAERESEKEGTTALGRMSKFTGEFFTAKNLYDLGEAMFLMQLVGGTVGHLKNRSDGKKADKILDSLGYDVSSAKDFTADEKWRAIDAYYRGMSKDEVNEMLEKGAKAMDGLLKQFESESLATVDGRDRMAALHPEAIKKIIEARKEGKDVSRKMIRDAGLSEDVWKDVAARNDLGDSFIADRKRAADLKRSKMDAYQASALADTISEFFGDSPEAAKVFDRIVADLKDASILDDPVGRENLVMEQGEKIWAEGREGRIKAARERAKAAEQADHQEAEAAQKKGISIPDNVVNGNTEVKNETRTDEAQQKPDEAQRIVPPEAEAARPVEAAETPAEVGGEVDAKTANPKADYPVGTIVERADGSTYIREDGDVVDVITGVSEPKWREVGNTGAAKNGNGRRAQQSHVFSGGGRVVQSPVKPSTSAPTEAKANTPTKSAEAVEDGSRGAETNPTKNDTSVARQTHDEAVEDVVAKAKSDGRKLDELGELRPPTPKIGSKPGRVSPLKKMDEKSVVNALKNVTSVDDVRGHLHRVHVENGEIVATDGRILLFGKAPKGMKDGEYATTPIGQKRIDDRYPLWKQVVPDAKRNGYKEVGVISNGDISTDSVAFAGRLNKRFHKEQRKDSPRADIRIGEQLVSPELLKNLTDAMFRLGVKDITVYQGKTINSPLLLKGRNADGEITGVIMPLRLGEDVDSAKKTHVRLFGKSTEESADKKTAHNSKNETKSAETAKQTPKNETKKSFEEKYREWAEEDAPAWAKDLSPEEKAEYERLLDELLRPKDGKSDIERAKKEAEDYRALMEFEKAHTPKRGRGRPKKEDVGAKADSPESLADNYAKFVQQRIDRFNSAKTSADFDKVKDFADGELEAREKVKSNPEAIKKFNEKYGKLFAEQNRVIHEATEKGRQAQEAETAKAEEDAKAFRASPEGFKQLEKDVNRTFGRYRLNVNSVHKPEEVVSVSDLIKRGYKVEKAKRGAAYNYRLTPPDGNGWFKIGKKELRLDGEAYNKAIADLIEYSERVAKGEKVVETSAEPTTAKVETAEAKPTKPDMKPVREAMRKLGTLGMADIPTLEKALKQAEGHGQTDRADMIKTLLDYKKNLPKYDDAKSDKSVGGRYRASIESEKPLDDPKFKAWAKRRGVVPTQAKREEYDAAMMKSAAKKLSRWIKGVKIKEVNAISEAELKGETRAASKRLSKPMTVEQVVPKQERRSFWGEFNKLKADYEHSNNGEHPLSGGLFTADAYYLYDIIDNKPISVERIPLDGRNREKIIAFDRKYKSEIYKGTRNSHDWYVRLSDELSANVQGDNDNRNGVGGVTSGEMDSRQSDRARGGVSNSRGSDASSGGDDLSSTIRLLRDGKRIVGSYNTKTGEVTLAKGASVETVAHELGWHASFDWAKESAKTNKKAKALYERMLRFAEDAPPEIKAEVAALYGELDADAFADEVGAMLFTRGKGAEFESAIYPDVDAPWYRKAWNTLVDIVKNFLSAHGMNRVDLDGVENMSEARFKDFLATAMLSGKTLGERKGFSMDLDMSKKAKWERKLSDRFAPIRDLIERVDGADGEAYRMVRTLEGMAQMGRNRAERAMKRVDKILGKDISPEFLAQYMQVRAYEERNAKIEKRNQKQDGSGMTAKDAEAILAQADKRGIVDKCEEAADILWKMQDEGLQRRVDAGLISQKTADEWRKAEPHHVPWRDAIDPDSGEWMGRNFAGKEFETAEGRSTFASGDPITLMLQEYENAYARAAENALRQHLSDIARLNADVGTIYDGITVDAKGKRSFIKYSKGEQAKLLSIPDGAKIESTKKDDGGMVNVLTFRENGDTKYLVLNGSLGEAVVAAVTGRSLARPNAKLAGFMRGYAATATALSPTFAIRNTMADHFDIHGNMVKDFGLWKGEKLFAKMVAEEGKMLKELLKYAHTGAFEVDANGKAATAFGKLIEEYEAAGGAIGGMRTEGYDVIQKRIQADFRAGRNRLRSIGKGIYARWTTLQKWSELSTRLATFKVMKESGMSAKEAAMWSRESTVDFNKKGNLTNMTNILWMFSNSALGSGVRQAKGLLTTKNGLKLAGGLAAWGFVEGMLECVMNEEDDDEAEKKGLGTSADLNEYTRQNAAYIRFGDKIYRTNLHMGPYGYLKYFGNVAARVMCGRMEVAKAAKELGLTAVEVGAAFTGMGNVSADALVETGVPTALQPFVQMATGKDYAGRPMYKTKDNEAKPDSSHGRTSTAEGYKKIAEGINWLSGGDKYSKGGIDIAPETVKLLAETAGKNLAKDIVNFAQLGSMAMSGDWDVRNMPFARDMVRKVDGNENRYYEALAKFNEDKYAYSNPNLTREEKRRYLREHPWLRTNGTIGGTVVGTLKKKIDEWRRLEEREDVSEENKAKYKEFRRKAQARVIELMTPGK